MMKQAYGLHTVHTAILQKRGKNNVYQPHSNNIHQLYNNKPSGHRENETQKVTFEVCPLVGFYTAL